MIPDLILTLFELILFASMTLCFWRLVIGPTAADRMVAIDLLGLLMAVLIISHALRTRDESMLDIVLVFGVVAFLGTVALARHLQRVAGQPTHSP